jgi:hypothetical protein
MGKLKADKIIKLIAETTGAPRIASYDGDRPWYKEGSYYIDEGNGYLYESSLSRVWQHIDKGHGFLMVSASRAERSPKVNKELHHRLKQMVRESGHGYVEVDRHYVENAGTPDERKVKEKDLLVPHNPKVMPFQKFAQHAEHLRNAFDQDSVLLVTPEKDVGLVTKNGFEKWGGVKFHPDKVGEYYSRMKFGKTFVLEGFRVPSNHTTSEMGMWTSRQDPLATVWADDDPREAHTRISTHRSNCTDKCG